LRAATFCALFAYAREIKETTDGSRRCIGRETRQEIKGIPKRCLEEHVSVDEPEAASRLRQNQTQETQEIEQQPLRLNDSVHSAGIANRSSGIRRGQR